MLRPPEYGYPPPVRAQRFVWWLRVLLVAAGLTPLVLLGTAAVLKPSAAGLGTHQQLGLPPCSLRQIARIRCPSCGMTTSWSHMVRGQVVEAFQANSGGALLALAAAVGGPWSIASGLLGRWLGGTPNEWTFAGISVGIMVITLIDWGVRLWWGL